MVFQTRLKLGTCFNHFTISNDGIPTSVTHLTISNGHNKNDIPNTVRHLVFDSNFNKSIKDMIPDTVTHLKFWFSFNQPIMEYSDSHRQGVIRYIHNSIIHLTFGERFNWLIAHGIPDLVIYLSFGSGHKR